MVDADTLRFIQVNAGACQGLGYSQEELLGMTPMDVAPDLDREGFLAVTAPLRNGEKKELVIETRHRRKDGSFYPVEMRLLWSDLEGPPVYVAIVLDTSERKAAEERLNYLAYHDDLTGLPNRLMLSMQLSQAIVQASRQRRLVALLFLNLDRFKNINDSLGHEAGDALLRQVATRLLDAVRHGDSVARNGHDEFSLLLTDIAQLSDVAPVVQKVMGIFHKPFLVGGEELFTTPSIGISVFPDDDHDPGVLMKNADTAMYHAKASGRNTFRFFTAEMNTHAERQMRLEMGMRRALECGEFQLHYQPQVDLACGGISGMEALIRWHRGEEMVSPAEFIPLAEETGLIVPIGEWVLRTACAQAVSWRKAGLPAVKISVNLSVRQFREDNLVELIKDILEDTGLESNLLELEITESAIMHDPDAVKDKLHQLKALGVGLAVDDFGTGYSSLAYIKRFPVDSLKIDRSFVQDIIREPGDAAIAQAIISLSHSLGIKVVAEGVETREQLAFLRMRGCDVVQGYYFSRPLAVEDMTRLLVENRRFEQIQRDEGGPEHTLLIVDDEANIRQALVRTLRREGYHILLASGPVEAFKVLAEHPVGVILSDQRMPDMPGIDFLNRVKDLYPHTVRIMLSGYTDLDSVTNAINRGAIYRFLTKPWEDDLLRQHLREAFHHYRFGYGNMAEHIDAG
jgi:diguanylate cyclase (GGDEF)-like protein/PAS domain S-box-containing protein